MTMPAKKSEPKIMDVSKPGKSAPPRTSRPVIVGHGPMAKDSTVVEEVKEPDTLNEPAVAPSTSHKKIVPLGDSEKPADAPAEEPKPDEVKPEEKQPDEVAAEPPKEESPKEEPPKEEPANEKSDEDKGESDSSDSGAVDAMAEQAEAKKKADKEAEAAIAKQQEIQKLVDSKKYNVPIGHDSTKKGGSKVALILLLVILVLAAGAYLAADAGVVKVNGFDVPYHLIGDK